MEANKCSDRTMEGLTTRPFANYDRATAAEPTDRPGHREVNLPIIEMKSKREPTE